MITENQQNMLSFDELDIKITKEEINELHGEFWFKILDVLGLESIGENEKELENTEDNDKELKTLFEIFDFNEDIEVIESKEENKIIYEFILNKKGIDKIKTLEYSKILNYILDEKINDKSLELDKRIELDAQKNILNNLEKGFFIKDDIIEIVKYLNLGEEFKKRIDDFNSYLKDELVIDSFEIERNSRTDTKINSKDVSGTKTSLLKKVIFITGMSGIIGGYSYAHKNNEIKFNDNRVEYIKTDLKK